MEPRELAEWMQREHKKVEVLVNSLREEIAVIPKVNVESWLDRLRDRYDHFRAHVVKHMALEEKDGYLAEVLERRPTLHDGVERLKREHGELTRMLASIHQALQDVGGDDRILIRDCCRRIEHMLADAERHENEENLMVLSVFSQDIGTKD